MWDEYVQYLDTLIPELRSEWPTAEIIIVDNNSSTQVGARSERVIQLHTRMSVGAARNAALGSVESDWVLFFDADDLPAPGWSQVARSHIGNDELSVICGSLRAWAQGVSETVDMGPRQRAREMQSSRLIFAMACVVRNQFATVGALLRTSLVRDAGGFMDDNYCEDWALGTSLAFRGRVLITDEEAVQVRISKHSVIHTEGTAAGIVRRLPKLHWRWISDPAIPVTAKPLFPWLALPRIRQAFIRFIRKRRSHDDLIETFGL